MRARKHVARMMMSDKCAALAGLLLATLAFTGCDRMITPRNAQILKDADAKAAQGDYLRAINLYEAALDDTPRCADIHYKLALLYDDKMQDSLNALHHFKRYLVLSPNGSHAAEVKKSIKRDEVALVTSLSGDSVLSPAEAAQLRNENLNLRKQLAERAPKPRDAWVKNSKRGSHAEGGSPVPENASGSEPRSYVVQPGDTLFSIARKFYKSASRWKDIRDANSDKVDKPGKLKPGTRLTIP